MARKSWVERAIASGDWSSAEKKARQHLRKSNIETLYRRYPGRPPSEMGADLKPVAVEVTVTLARAYKTYQARGGNRGLPETVLEALGKTRIENLDRATVGKVARKLFPRLTEAQRGELVYDPIDEIVGLGRVVPKSERPAVPGRYDPYAYWLSRKDELRAETERLEAIYEPLVSARHESELDRLYRRKDILIDEQGNVWGSRGPDWPHHDGPPALPVTLERGDRPPYAPTTKRGQGRVWRQTDHHTLYSRPLKQNQFGDYEAGGKGTHPGTKIRPGKPPSGKEASERYDLDGHYLGWLSKSGRPRKANKLSNAEKQRRYRERRKLQK